MTLFNNTNVSLEMIGFQSKEFGMGIEAIVGRISNKITASTSQKSIAEFPEIKELEELVFNRLGIKTKWKVGSMLAAVLPFYLNKNHIFLNEFFRGNVSIPDQNKIIKEMNGQTGTVDDNLARVGGMFSKMPVVMFINFKQLVMEYKASPASITGIILHELGHAYYAFSYAAHSASVNMVLAHAMKAANGDSPRKVSLVYRELKKLDPELLEKDIDQIVQDGTVVPGEKLVRLSSLIVTSVMKNKKYDETSFEQMADNFAARFGYGLDVVKGLESLYKGQYNSLMFFNSRMLDLATVCYLIVGLCSLFTSPILILALLNLLFGYALMRITGSDIKDMTYDDLEVRYKRIRDQYVTLLKDADIDKDHATQVVEEIKALDEIIKRVKTSYPIFRDVVDILFGSARRAKNSVEHQKLMEVLASNDLYLQSAKLKQLA